MVGFSRKGGIKVDNKKVSVKISSEVDKKLTKYSKATGVSKRFVMDNSVLDYISRFASDTEKVGRK